MKKDKKETRKYTRYDQAFKTEAINLMNQGRSVKELSGLLGVKEGVLYNWKSGSKSNRPRPSEETRQLKSENKRLKEQVEILKKALSIFSRSD